MSTLTQTVYYFEGGPADGQGAKFEIDLPFPEKLIHEVPVICLDDEMRGYEYVLERMPNGVWRGVPNPDVDQTWWEWGAFLAEVTRRNLWRMKP